MRGQTDGAASQGHPPTWEEAASIRERAQGRPVANYIAKVTASTKEHDYLEANAALCLLSLP